MIDEELRNLFRCDLTRLKTEIELYKNDYRIWHTERSIANSTGNLCLHLIGNLKTYVGAGIGNINYVRDRDLEFSAKDIPAGVLLREIDDSLVTFSLKFKQPESDSVQQLILKPKVILQPFNDIPKYHQFATAVIMFGAILRSSKYVNEVSWNTIQQIAATAVDEDSFSQKEFLTILHQAKNIYSKKRKKSKGE